MKANYEAKLTGLFLGGGLVGGSASALIDKSLGIGILVAGICTIIFWLLIKGEESK